jgi:hypothetical protein
MKMTTIGTEAVLGMTKPGACIQQSGNYKMKMTTIGRGCPRNDNTGHMHITKWE